MRSLGSLPSLLVIFCRHATGKANTLIVTFVGINLVEAGVIEFVSSEIPAYCFVQFVIMLVQDRA